MMVRKCAGSIGELVEGPMWCKKRNSLFFTDILNGTVFEYIPKTEKIQHWKLGTYVGCIIPGRDRDEMIAAVDDCLNVFHPEDGRAETLCRFPMADGIRFNDGKCGPGGQLWIGTMAVSGQKDRPDGGLYRIGPDGRTCCVEPSLAIPNGMAWDLEKGIFYHVRTEEQAVYSYSCHQDWHTIRNPKKSVDLSGEKGVPDGMAIDRDGNLWIAMWGGYKVICVNPASGMKLMEVALPDADVSSCTFGGGHLDELYITTAREGQAGGNVYVADAGVTGTYPYEFCWKEEEEK